MPGLRLGLGLGLHGSGGGAGAAHQQILDQATADGWHAVYDPTNPDTRTLRNDGANDFFSAIADGLGNLPDMVQATAGSQPQLVEGHFGQLDAGLFSSSHLATGAFSAALSQPNFQVALIEETAGQTDDPNMTNGDVAGNRNSLSLDGTAPSRTLRLYAGQGPHNTGLVSGANKEIIGGLFNGASSNGYLNSAEGTAGNAGTEALDGLVVGTNLGRTKPFDGHIGLVLVYDGDPGATKRQRMFDLLHDLTGIAKA